MKTLDRWRLRNAVHKYVTSNRHSTLMSRAYDMSQSESALEFEEELFARVCAIQDIYESDRVEVPSEPITPDFYSPSIIRRGMSAMQSVTVNPRRRVDGAR